MAGLNGRTIFITGATRGIGREIALRCARDGANIVVTGKTSEPHPKLPGTIHTVAREVEAAGGAALPIQLDVRDADAVAEAVTQAVAEFGGLDCLVNNAGRHPPHKPIDAFTLDDFRSLLELNLVSVFALCQAALPHLRRTRGSIINIASLVGSMGQRWAATYAATKGAIVAFTRSLAQALAERGYAIAIHYHRSADEARDTVSLLEKRGIKALAVQADFTDDGAVRSMMDTVLDKFGRLDALVNSAADWKPKKLEDVTAADLRYYRCRTA